MEMSGLDSVSPHDDDRPAADDDLVSVLFIEDDRDLAEMYRLKLETDGYRVTIVGAEEATAKPIRRDLPDLIYLDIRMPHRDRVGVLKNLRVNRSTRKIPVVILSDYRPQELTEAGATFGFGEYVISATAQPSLSASITEWSARQAELD
jgi:DNA-binding response OmpR family regulator